MSILFLDDHSHLSFINDRIKKAEKRLEQNPYDVEAWSIIVRDAQSKKIEDARSHYEKLITQFPSAGRYWKLYIEHEMKSRNYERVEKLFTRCLVKVLNIDLWRTYLCYVKETKGSLPSYREKMAQAYDFALEKMGMDIMSYPIWNDYITFLKNVEAVGSYAENQRITAVRKVYQRGIINPMTNIEQLWKDYVAYEQGINPIIADKMIQDRSRDYMNARRVAKEYEAVTRGLNRNAPSTPPQGLPEEIKQVDLWKKYIAWEKSNPLRTEDHAILTKRVMFAYEQCLLCLGHHPDIWYEAALFLEQSSKFLNEKGGYSRKGAALAYLKRHEDALNAYREGLQLDPNNQQLKDGIKEVQSQMSQNQFGGGFPNPFVGANVFEKLRNDPRTKDFFSDPTYLKLIADLQQNPQSMLEKMKDPRVMTTLSVLLGIDLSGAANAGDDEDDIEMDAPSKPETPKPKEEPMEVELSDEKKQAIAEKEKGNELYKEKKFEEALACYDKAIELDPTEMLFLTNKAAVYFEQKDYEKCIKECEKAVEIGKEHRADFKKFAKAYSRMAAAYVKMKDYYNAKTYYQKSLTEQRTRETLVKLSEVEKIIKEEEKKAYIDPEKALEEKNKGKECFQKGDYPASMKHYTEAIRRNPDEAILYSNRAACYQKLAEFQLALKDCETCIKLDPNFVKGYIRKGYALMALKEHAKASSAFQKALELDSNNQEAIDGYRKCIAASSSNPEEVRKQAMSDPEVQKILGDPAMRLILEQMQNDPKALQEHLKNPEIAAKIQKLLESGLIAIR